jgi:hypothetical protein
LLSRCLQRLVSTADDVDFCSVCFESFGHHKSESYMHISDLFNVQLSVLPVPPPVITTTKPFTPNRVAASSEAIVLEYN